MIAFVRGWHLAVVLLFCIPAIVAAAGAASLIMSRMSSRAQNAYAEAGNVVEQTIGAIRTVRIGLRPLFSDLTSFGENNKTFLRRVWKPLHNRCVLKL